MQNDFNRRCFTQEPYRTILSRCATLPLFLLLFATPTFAQFTLTGQVNIDGGAPAANVDIDVFFAGTTSAVALSGDVTDVNGNFSTVGLMAPAGLYDIVFNPPTGSNLFPLTLTNQLLPTAQALGVRTLESGLFLSGRVVNEAGVGLSEIDLQIRDSANVLLVVSGDVTDALGFFEVLLRPDTYRVEFRETALTPGGPFVSRELVDIPLTGTDINLADTVLRLGVLLTGSVTNGLGAPLFGADLDAFDALTGEEYPLSGDSTDLNGMVTVLVPLGDIMLEVDPPLGQQLVPQLINLAILPAPAVNTFSAQLPSGVLVTGTTVDSTSMPVPNVDLDFLISATGIEIPTADDNANTMGNFSVVVEQETYDIEFRPSFASGFAPLLLSNRSVGAIGLDLGAVVLDPGNAITGTITSAATALSGASVTAADTGGNRVVVFGGQSDLLGDYAIRLTPAIYNLTFTPPPGSGLTAQTIMVDILAGDAIVDVDLSTATPPPAVTALSCDVTSPDVELLWSNAATDYDSIDIVRDGTLVATLAGTATNFIDDSLSAATYNYDVFAVRSNLDSAATTCTAMVAIVTSDFVRGDVNASGGPVNLLDGLALLNGLFLGGPIPCRDAADPNDDGSVGLVDALVVLNYLFLQGSPPEPPFPNCGDDAVNPDTLDCVSFDPCP